MTKLYTENISVKKGDKVILREINVSVPPGSLTVLLGPNGAGKTTLLKTLAGLEKPEKGKIFLEENDLRQLSSLERARKIGWCPETNQIPFSFSVLETVLMGRYPWHLGQPQPEDETAARDMMATLNISGLSDTPVTVLSAGERQKSAIARTLIGKTEVLLFDEPFSNLDISSTLYMVKIFQELAARGKTVVLSLHDVSLAYRFATHVIALSHGQVMATGKSGEVLLPGIIEKIFQVKTEILDTRDGYKTLYFTNKTSIE